MHHQKQRKRLKTSLDFKNRRAAVYKDTQASGFWKAARRSRQFEGVVQPKTNAQMAIKASIVTIVADSLLSTFQLIAGIIGNSTASIADAIHSFSDMFTTFIVMIGVKLSNRKADKSHPYGHERFECVAAILLSVILFLTGAGIGWAGLQRIIHMDPTNPIIPGFIALIGALSSIILKEIMFRYKRAVARKIDSSSLMADAWHHRSDSLSSIGSFLGIFGARMGFPFLDPLAAILICLFIFKIAISIFCESVGKMTDRACDEELENEMRAVIMAQNGVERIDTLRTRIFGDRIYVEVEIALESSMTLRDSHEIAHQVHDEIEAKFVKVKHCTVHVNPA